MTVEWSGRDEVASSDAEEAEGIVRCQYVSEMEVGVLQDTAPVFLLMRAIPFPGFKERQ